MVTCLATGRLKRIGLTDLEIAADESTAHVQTVQQGHHQDVSWTGLADNPDPFGGVGFDLSGIYGGVGAVRGATASGTVNGAKFSSDMVKHWLDFGFLDQESDVAVFNPVFVQAGPWTFQKTISSDGTVSFSVSVRS